MCSVKRSCSLFFIFLFLCTACVPLQPVTRSERASSTLPVMNELVRDIEVAGEPGLFTTPLDATPNATGDTIYFTALGEGDNGLFQVPAAGGEVVALLAGEPLVQPQGLDISGDDATLYVADSAADQLFAVAVSDGSVQPLAGTEGTKPRGVEVIGEDSQEIVYFSGVDPADGQPAIMKIAATGGELTVITKGAPLADPVGVTVAGDGTLYVVDQAAGGGEGLGSLFKLSEGTVEPMATNLHVGQFPGLALTLDEAALLVSTLATSRNSAQVLVTLLASGDQVIVNQVIAANQGAGGLHRAQNGNTFAWADAPNSGSGRVYRVRLP